MPPRLHNLTACAWVLSDTFSLQKDYKMSNFPEYAAANNRVKMHLEKLNNFILLPRKKIPQVLNGWLIVNLYQNIKETHLSIRGV